LDNLEYIEDFEKIKALNTNFDLLITTRKDMDKQNQLNLDTLNPKDAKDLFLSIFNEDVNIEDILVYLDNHPLFITLTAKSLDKKYITLEELRENIKNNTISKIDSKDDKTFQEHLQNTFDRQFKSESKDELKELLQILAIFPSIEISFDILQKSIGLEKLRVNLQKLVERGWLTNKENSYKLHQIIRTFILSEYKIEYEKVTFIFENIAKYINPNDSTLIVNRLNGYIPIIESFLELFKEKDDEFICGLLDSIMFLFYFLAQYKKAFDYQNRALQIRIKNHGDNSEFVAKSYNFLSLIYQDMGELKKALEYQERALKLREELLDEKDLDLLISYNNISLIYKDIEDLKKAFVYQEKALKLAEDILEKKHPFLAISYNNISMIYKNLGGKENLKKALKYQEKSLNLDVDILEEKHHNIASSYNNISTIYQAMGDLNKALEYQEEALKLREEILREKHPELAQSYNNISTIYKDLKECLKAKEYMQKAINIWKEYEYYNKDLYDARNYMKEIDYNIRKNKKRRFCKDI
jgi:tetratricopeptide (TPR) repeat protein